MIRTYVVFAVIIAGYGCSDDRGTQNDKHQSLDGMSNLLTASDLKPPAYKTLSAFDLEQNLSHEDELFEYRRPEDAATAEANIRGCFKEFFDKQPVSVDGIRMRYSYSLDQEVLDCFFQEIANSIEQAAIENGTDYEPQEEYDPKAACEESENDSSGEFSAAGTKTQSEIFSDRDLTQYADWSMADLLKASLDTGDASYLYDQKARYKTEARTVMDGDICASKKFARYHRHVVSKEDCEVQNLASDMHAESCTKVYVSKIVKVKSGDMSLSDIREERGDETYHKEKGFHVTRVRGAMFPHAGTKNVTYRNWTGTITFSDDYPTYRFTKGDEVVEGVFEPR